MKRLIDTKIMAIALDEMLHDPIKINQITNEFSNLKKYVQNQRKILDKKRINHELTELEEYFISPALDDAYFYLLDSLKSNTRPSDEMKRIVSDIPSRIDYWLMQIK